MDYNKFELFEWAHKGADLLSRSQQCLSTAANEKIQELSERIPPELLPEDKSITLVFAGQYSAGKSSIIKVLTGKEDIAIGAGIITEIAKPYNWAGISLIDTPGVQTQVRPEHDEITHKAIASADLLVFVVTNELLDSQMAQHFRDLAIEQDKAHEMMLVVNKMQRCAKGNTSEAQEIIRNDLRKVLAPITPEEMRISFIDAKAALDGKTEIDSNIGAILLKKSRIDEFTMELNKFVREKGLASRCTTALYELEQILQEALASITTGDPDIDAIEEILLQRRRTILDTQDRIPRLIEGEIQTGGSQIREKGRMLADMVNYSATEKSLNEAFDQATEQVQKISQKIELAIPEIINKQLEILDGNCSLIAVSDLAKELNASLEKKINILKSSPDAIRNLGNIAKKAEEFGKFLVSNSFKATNATFAGAFKLNQYSNTVAHGMVKDIGHFFGKKFIPWEAVKYTRHVANVGRGLMVAGAILPLLLQWKEDSDAEKHQRELRDMRSGVCSDFNDAAHAIEMHFDKLTQTYIADTFTPHINDIDRQLTEFRNMNQIKNDLYDNLTDLLNETKSLIKEIHQDQKEVA